MKSRAQSETLAIVACQKLLADAIGGLFAFGRKLKIGVLCERSGVGAAPMREALNRAANDLVQESDQRGFSVAALSADDLDDLLKTRLVLNEYALRKSFEFGGDEWEEQIMLAWLRLSRIPCTPISVDPKWEHAHRTFQAILLSACRAPRIIAYCDQLFDSNDRYRFMARTSRTRTPRSSDHNLITDAVIARRPDEAVALLSLHLAETASRCKEQLMLEGRAQRSGRASSWSYVTSEDKWKWSIATCKNCSNLNAGAAQKYPTAASPRSGSFLRTTTSISTHPVGSMTRQPILQG